MALAMSARGVTAALAVCVLVIAVIAAGATRSDASSGAMWVAAWGRSFTGGGAAPRDASVRNIARLTIGGTAIRIRLTNTSASPMRIGAAYVARQLVASGPALVAGSTRQITFGGATSVTVPARTDALYSDPVDFPVAAQQHIAVSLYLPEASPGAATSQWSLAYRTPDGAGNAAADETGLAFALPIANSTYALTGIDVLTTEADGSVAFLGSSTFQGWDSTPDGYDDVIVQLSARINSELPAGKRKGLVNAGVGGDTLRASIAQRLERDVFSHTAVKGVVVYNVNDLGQGRSALQVAQDYMTLIGQAHPRGVKVFCPTWPPATQSRTSAAQRALLNGWLLNSGNCDGSADWDAIVRWETGDRLMYRPEYQGDTIHMNRFGHQALANSVPLGWFTDGWHFGPQPGDPPVLLPELVIFSEDIAVSGEKETTTITASIRNVGDAGAANVVVRFLVDGAHLSDHAIASVAQDGTATATATWNTKTVSGDHTVTVVIDPNGAIREGRTDNNTASRTVTVTGNRVP